MFLRPKVFFPTVIMVLLGLGCSWPAYSRQLVMTFDQSDSLPPPPHPGYRAPTDPNTLFYIQRSTNANIIVYAANLTPQGQFDPRNPIDIFWRVFDEDGRRHGINLIERLLAYGVTIRPVKGVPNSFDVNVVSFPEMKCRAEFDEAGRAECLVQINGRCARLVSAYVELDQSGIIPRPLFLDIYGIDKSNGRVLHEHIEAATG
jgi:hypothetical protein